MLERNAYPQLLAQYEKVIYRVIWQQQISPYATFYDDLFQQMQLHLYQCACQFDGDPLSEADCYRFTAYALRYLNWRIVDDLRRILRLKEREAVRETDDYLVCGTYYNQETLMSQTFLAAARKCLLPKMYGFLLDMVCYDNQTLMAKYGLSKQVLHGRKKRIAKKLLPLKYLLEEDKVC